MGSHGGWTIFAPVLRAELDLFGIERGSCVTVQEIVLRGMSNLSAEAVCDSMFKFFSEGDRARTFVCLSLRAAWESLSGLKNLFEII